MGKTLWFEGHTTPFQLGMPTKEIGRMSEANMTPTHIIVAATKNAAVLIGKKDPL